MNYVLLLVSALLCTGYYMLTKGASAFLDSKGRFYCSQAFFFGFAAVLAFFVTLPSLAETQPLTVLLGVIYGIFFIGSQWCYTLASKQGPASICVMINSFAFVIPTIAGPVFWKETLTLFNIIGIILVIPAVVLTVKPDKTEKKGSKLYFIPLFTAMVFSGAIGAMQKVQQTSAVSDQMPAFVMVAAITACVGSVLMTLTRIKAEGKGVMLPKKGLLFISLAGLCFSAINFLNITCVGRLGAVVFFPMYNVINIMLSLICSVVLFKEKPRRADYFAFTIGIISILIFNL